MALVVRASNSLSSWVKLHRRSLATSFAQLYRKSVDNALVQPGDIVKGRVVGYRRPRASSSRFYIVDFGVKNEAPFSSKEIPGFSATGDEVTLPMLELEDDFNEPVFDHERRAELPSVLAERYALLTKTGIDDTRLVHGRFAGFKKGGASVKVLGTDAFAPRHHVVGIDRPVLGSYAPFYIMSVSIEKKKAGRTPSLDINPIVSSYGGFLFSLTNLVGFDDSWEKSGGGTPKERLSYLRLLTRLLSQKNSAVRRILPRHTGGDRRPRFRDRSNRQHSPERDSGDAAWLNDLPQTDWASSRTGDREGSGKSWDRFRRPVAIQPPPRAQQRAQVNNSGRGPESGPEFPRGRGPARGGKRPGEK